MSVCYNYIMKILSKKNKEEKKTELEKVEERREEILARGRKFKYPLQYTKHRIVINTILIMMVVLAIFVVGGWFALYRIQMTDEIIYRITTVVPVSVANVDGERVRYSDYLMLYRSSISSIERQSGELNDNDDAAALRQQYKKVALTDAEKYTYAIKLAKELGISITDEEVDSEFDRHRQVGGVDRKEEGFLKIINDNFGLNKTEYRRMLYLNLLQAKVKESVDDVARETAMRVEQILAENGGNYGAVAEKLGSAISYEETGGLIENTNIDGGRATEATKLEVGEQSGKFISINGDGYYFIKLIAKTDSKVNFVSIYVPFKEFDVDFAKIKEDGLISEAISLE